MPNHVINEIIFRGLHAEKREEIVASAINAEGVVDFSTLIPIPLNVWQGSVGSRHEKAFKLVALDWCRQNWGTKWNAYSHHPIEQTDDVLIFRFETAWTPPYGWLLAIFNRFKTSFDHNWLDEGAELGVCGKFNAVYIFDDMRGDPWREEPADDAMHRHLHKLKFGVEEFPPEPEEDAA